MRCLLVWIHGWLGKIKWNIVTSKKGFLLSPKHGRYTDSDHAHTKRNNEDLEIKYLGEYHDLCAQSNTLLLMDLFRNF